MISYTINNRGQTDIIFLDFAKAFDKVSHPKLLLKIKTIFKNPQLSEWFSSYLSHRNQFVACEGYQSSFSPVESGAPQGSVLGPLLFLLFINDMPQDITVPIRLFADDCVLYNRVETHADQIELNSNLQKIKKWCDSWQMVLNSEKTVYMSITRKRNTIDYAYSIEGAALKRVFTYTYLGVKLTSDLRWNEHVDFVCTKARKALWSLRRNMYNATPEVKCLAYKTLIRPILEYAKIVWDPYTSSNHTKLDKIQRLAARFIFNKYRRCHSPTQLCELADLPSLESRTEYDRLKFLYLIIHGHVKINKDDYFHISPNSYFRHRHSMYIPPPCTRNDCFKYSFFPRAIKQWNLLSEDTVRTSSINNFLEIIKITCVRIP